MIATPIRSRFHSKRCGVWMGARERLENIQIHSGFEVEVIDDEKKTLPLPLPPPPSSLSHWISWHATPFFLSFSTDFFCHFRHTFGISFAKPHIPAFGNASSVLSQFNAFDTKATAMAPNAYANSKQLLIFRHAKNERELERRFFECSKIVFRFIRERISFEILEFPCALIRIATPHRSLSASKAIKRANDVRHARKFMTMCCESRNRKASYMQFKWFTPGNIKF